jgi:hypothetical protein
MNQGERGRSSIYHLNKCSDACCRSLFAAVVRYFPCRPVSPIRDRQKRVSEKPAYTIERTTFAGD